MRSFVIPAGQQSLLDTLAQLDPKGRYVVEVKEYKRARSLEQNARYWAILTHIAEQLPDENDRMYSTETWHEFFKAKFLGKDTLIIDGEPVLVQKTTTKLKVLEFGDYMTQVEAWAVDHDVKFYDQLQEAS